MAIDSEARVCTWGAKWHKRKDLNRPQTCRYMLGSLLSQGSINSYHQRLQLKPTLHKASMRQQIRSKLWCKLSQCELPLKTFAHLDSTLSSRHSFSSPEPSKLSHGSLHAKQFDCSNRWLMTLEWHMRMWRELPQTDDCQMCQLSSQRCTMSSNLLGRSDPKVQAMERWPKGCC